MLRLAFYTHTLHFRNANLFHISHRHSKFKTSMKAFLNVSGNVKKKICEAQLTCCSYLPNGAIEIIWQPVVRVNVDLYTLMNTNSTLKTFTETLTSLITTDMAPGYRPVLGIDRRQEHGPFLWQHTHTGDTFDSPRNTHISVPSMSTYYYLRLYRCLQAVLSIQETQNHAYTCIFIPLYHTI